MRDSSSPVTDLTLTEIIPPSPAAMEIAKGIAYPVDLSSGLLDIEIPLYEIVSGDIRIPITLSYHASGLKPGIHSRAWLPQGWSLSVGPTLTRVIHGGPDEFSYDATIANAASPTWEQLNAVETQTADIALDEFYYSLPGHSGRLYFTRTPVGSGSGVDITPVTVPSDSIAISLPDPNGDFQRQVSMTDPLGIKYRFGSATDNSYLDRTPARSSAPVSGDPRQLPPPTSTPTPGRDTSPPRIPSRYSTRRATPSRWSPPSPSTRRHRTPAR